MTRTDSWSPHGLYSCLHAVREAVLCHLQHCYCAGERFSCNCSFFLFCSCSLRCSWASDNSTPLFNLDHWAMSLFLKAFSVRSLAATTYHILTLDLDEAKMYTSPFFSPLLLSLDFSGGEPWSRAQCAADL